MELESMKEDELLSEAMKRGYNPDYEGENKKSPKEFLAVSFNHNKMLKENNEKLSAEIDQLHEKLNRVIEFTAEQKQKAVEKAISQLKAERKEAISEGDHAKVEEIDEEISQQSQQTVANNENEIILKSWLTNNPWYEKDEDLAIEADIIARQLQETGRFLPNQADYKKLLAQVEARVKSRFPDKFKNPKKDDPPEVESGRATPPRESKKTYADLPPDAKKACDQFVKDKTMTKEQYLDLYEWD